MTEEEIINFVRRFGEIHPKIQRNFIGLLINTHENTRKAYIKNSADRALSILKSLGFKLEMRDKYNSHLDFNNIRYVLNNTISGFSLDVRIQGENHARKMRCTILFAKQDDEKIAKKLLKFVNQVHAATILES